MSIEDTIRTWLFNPIVSKLVTLLIGIVAIFVIVRIGQRSVGRYVKSSEVRYRLRKGVAFVGYLVAILFIGAVFNERLGQFTVAFGVAGAGIAFALQEVIASVAGWLAVSVGGFFSPGDRIQLGGIRGDVIDIGILRTTLMECGQWVNADQYNGRIVRIANSFVFKELVFNYSADYPFLWDEIMVPIKYGSNYRLAREIIQRVADEIIGDYAASAEAAWQNVVRKFMIENASVRPQVTLLANQNWLEFTLRYVVDFKVRRVTKDKLFVRILEEIDKTQDEVGIAASTLNIEKLAPLEIRLPGGWPLATEPGPPKPA